MSTGRLGAGDTAIQPTILDAKGDLIVATAADTPARLAVGSANQVLTVDSSTATGLKWAAAASPSYTWTNFTPSIANFTIGNGTVNARYVQIDKIVIGYVVATLGSTSSVSGNLYFSLPVARASTAEMTPVTAMSDIGSGPAPQAGFVTSTLIGYRVGKTDGTYLTGVQTTSSIPGTWTTGTSFSWNFTYEAA